MRTYFKTLFRMFSKHITRFLTIIAIVLISMGISAGLGEVEDKIDTALTNYYQEQNIPDFVVKSTSLLGFSSADIDAIEAEYGSAGFAKNMCMDTDVEGQLTRVYVSDYINPQEINKLELVSGRMPTALNEIVVERATNSIKSYKIGDTVHFSISMGISIERDFTVVGIVVNPLIMHKDKEPSLEDQNKNILQAIYIDETNFAGTLLSGRYNELYFSLEDDKLFDGFSDSYEKKVKEVKEEFSDKYPDFAVLTLYENFGVYSTHYYAHTVGQISLIFIIFFALITMLVEFSTMTRLFDEERGQIACLKTLGYSNSMIISKYVLFVLISTLIGGALSFGIGVLVTKVLYNAFNIQYQMPEFPEGSSYPYYFITFAVILVVTLVLTIVAALKMVRVKPVTLLTPKAPKAGKKTFIEKIPFIWKRLSFKYKSTFRNVLLFKSRFFMTVISIMGSAILVLAGLGLWDCALKRENAQSIVTISIVLVVFSALLSALVIYNITNINISERNREIATLMVLGYQNKEVAGYIFREIYIMSIIGALLGLPLGYGFLEFVFNLVDFGSVADVNWWTWIITPLITIVFSSLASLLLYPKLTKTDMNASLKTLE